MFEEASRMKLRFNTRRGVVSVEDLWDLPLKDDRLGRLDLDGIALELYDAMKSRTDVVSFVDPEEKPDRTTKLQFDIVKHIIDVKLAEKKAAQEAAKKRDNKQKILSIISRKQDAELEGRSVEELQEMVASL